MTKNFVAIMRRNGKILKLDKKQLTENVQTSMEKSIELKWSPIHLPVAEFYEDKSKVDEIGLKWMFVDDLV